MRAFLATFLLPCVVVAVGFGCSRRHGLAAPPPATMPAAAPAARSFDRPDLGVRLDRPDGWDDQPSQDFVLLLAPAAGGGASLSLDVPDLPLHIPGLIPIGSVRGGYLDDLRKAVGPTQTTSLTPPGVPDAAARIVRSTWTDPAGRPHQETALLLVHADRVYILRARSPAPDEPATRAAFDEIIRSLQWTRKPNAGRSN
jgi:hypothetical protein